MKKLFLICLTCLIALPFALGAPGDAKRLAIARGLYGKIRVAPHTADFKIRKVSCNADLKVRLVNSDATRVGLWQFVDYDEDFRVCFVDHDEDLAICYVNCNEGVD